MQQKAPPQWALKAGRTSAQDVALWVEGARGTGWAAPVLMLTARDVVYAERGLIRKQVRRVPREKVSSVDYNSGIIWDAVVLNVAGGDMPDLSMKINRMRRQDAEAFMDAIRGDTSAPAAAT